jgi:hypothetical protein
MTTSPQAPMAEVGEMYLVHTMMRREFSLLPDDLRGFRLAAPDELRE